MATHRIRLTPFNKRSGALARRLTIGGQLFEADRWYEVSPAVCEKLRPLLQDSGTPFFQIVTEEKEWQDIVRRELAERVGGPGAAALAAMVTSPAPEPSAPPKREGEVRKSRFDGIRAAEVSEEDAAKAAVAAMSPTPVAAQVVEQTKNERPEPPDWDVMTKAQVIQFAATRGIELDPRLVKREMVSTIMAELFDAD